jgi:hypothetical protein
MIRSDLAQFGPLIQLTPDGADFIVTGKVTMAPLPGGQQQVEIAWTVTWPNGKVVGKVSQLNSVPVGSLDLYWGDVAGAVAQEASGGINAVVERFIDSNKEASGEGKATAQGGAPGVPSIVPGPVDAGGRSAPSPAGSAPNPANATRAGSAPNAGTTTPGGSASGSTSAVPASSAPTTPPASRAPNKTSAAPAGIAAGKGPIAGQGAATGTAKEGIAPVDGTQSDAPPNRP